MSASGVLPQVQHTLVWRWDFFIGWLVSEPGVWVCPLLQHWYYRHNSMPVSQLLLCFLVSHYDQSKLYKRKCLTGLWFQRVRVYNGGVKVWRQGVEDSRLTLQRGGTDTHWEWYKSSEACPCDNFSKKNTSLLFLAVPPPGDQVLRPRCLWGIYSFKQLHPTF